MDGDVNGLRRAISLVLNSLSFPKRIGIGIVEYSLD